MMTMTLCLCPRKIWWKKIVLQFSFSLKMIAFKFDQHDDRHSHLAGLSTDFRRKVSTSTLWLSVTWEEHFHPLFKDNSYYPHYPNFVCAKNKIITIAVQASWLIGKSDNVESNRFSDSPANQQSCSNFSSVFLLSHNVNFCTVQKKEEISVDPVDILLFCEFLNNMIRVIVLTQVSVLLLLHYWLVVQPCCCWKTNLKILWNCFLCNSKDQHCTESWQVQRRQVV